MIKFYFDELFRDVEIKTWLFPGGEVGVKLNITPKVDEWLFMAYSLTLVARLNNANDILTLMQVKNAIDEYCLNKGYDIPEMNLVLPYVPYGQQDRVCDKGEAFSLKVFANLINSLGFKRIVYADPHSDVVKATMGGASVSRFDIIDQHEELRNNLNKGLLVSPDVGANKQTAVLAKYFNHERFIRADKLRNLATGEIIETIVYGEVPKTVVITDDICVGGRTFIELAKVLRAKGAETIILYVTHLVGAQVKHLYDQIDYIYTTNSYRESWPNDYVEGKLFMVDIEPLLLEKIP